MDITSSYVNKSSNCNCSNDAENNCNWHPNDWCSPNVKHLTCNKNLIQLHTPRKKYKSVTGVVLYGIKAKKKKGTSLFPIYPLLGTYLYLKWYISTLKAHTSTFWKGAVLVAVYLLYMQIININVGIFCTINVQICD